MEIITENLGKKFVRDWIFKQFNFHFLPQKSYAITGPNGSGKSTLLQIIAGIMPHTQGKIRYLSGKHPVSQEFLYQSISIATPYMELIEEFTLQELYDFHIKFRKPRQPQTAAEFAAYLSLSSSLKKEIRHFSSGMKQKIKLGLAFSFSAELILLDEPTINLDAAGIDWYLRQVQCMAGNATLVICSNQPYEYAFCDEIIDIECFK
jgi:ABC-type multidrug transport system ATPase subunit